MSRIAQSMCNSQAQPLAVTIVTAPISTQRSSAGSGANPEVAVSVDMMQFLPLF